MPRPLGPLGPLGLLALSACGGAAPLMHPVHPLPDGEVTVGAGFSGTLPISGEAIAEDDTSARVYEEGAFAPGLAPWVSGRVGLAQDWEGGVTYTARSIRADARHAFVFGDQALSLGLGVSGLLPKNREDLGLRVGGFGFDVPFLYGWRSDADIYSLWLGPRGGAEYLTGRREVGADPQEPDLLLVEKVQGWHAQVGGLLGMRVGFRHVFAVLELDAAMHFAGGTVGETEVTLSQFNLAPAGAIIVKF
ncbi:MAG: hypothetical protein R3B72_42445 [Polyangiaceae bacterium]